MSGQPRSPGPGPAGATSQPGRTRAPVDLPPSAWAFPPASQADEDGIVGIGADLDAPTLVAAYRGGMFPWPHGWPSLPWFSPDPRAVIRPETLHVSRSLQRTLRRSGWHTTCDLAFDAVVDGCASARNDGTWITPAMIDAYARLHDLGWAHSIEVWDDDSLVGGLYGVQVGAVFTGESMFSRVRDASKVAMCDVLDRFAEAGGQVLDAQLMTAHLASMGAIPVSRQRWLAELAELVDEPVRMLTARLPVARLARGRLEPI